MVSFAVKADKCAVLVAVFGVYSRQQQERTLVKVLLEDKQYVLFGILISLLFYEKIWFVLYVFEIGIQFSPSV
jgi:hypothetical protein